MCLLSPYPVFLCATRLIPHVFNESPVGRTPGFISQFTLYEYPIILINHLRPEFSNFRNLHSKLCCDHLIILVMFQENLLKHNSLISNQGSIATFGMFLDIAKDSRHGCIIRPVNIFSLNWKSYDCVIILNASHSFYSLHWWSFCQ